MLGWLSAVAVAEPLVIKAGYDIFRTTGARMDFSKTPIPGEFFDTGSSIFSGLITFEGKPISEFKGISLPLPSQEQPENQIDTIIYREEDAVLEDIGSQVTIPIQMVALSLRSVTPIKIRNLSGKFEFWDVVIVSPNNPIGEATIRRESDKGGTYDAVILVNGIYTFTRRGDGAERTLDITQIGIPPKVFKIVDTPWMSEMTGSSGNFLVTSIDGLTTNFIPAYSVTKGRINVCGVGLESPAAGHGHAVPSPSPKNFFLNSPCLLVNLSSFNVTVLKEWVFLRWETGSETTNAGFRLWRAIHDGRDEEYKDLSTLTKLPDNRLIAVSITDGLSGLIPAKGNEREETTYSYVDISAQKENVTFYYLLEDVDTNGQITLHCKNIQAVTIGQGPAIDLEKAETYCRSQCDENAGNMIICK